MSETTEKHIVDHIKELQNMCYKENGRIIPKEERRQFIRDEL